MKAYSNNLDYQGLVTAYEKAKEIFEVTKGKKKAIKAFFKATKKEETVTKVPILIAHIQFRQAKLKQKYEKLAVRIAKLNLKEWVKSFEKRQNRTKKTVAKIDGIETAMLKNGAGNQADTKAKIKPEKPEKDIKLIKKAVEKPAVEVKEVKKVVAKKVAEKPAIEAKKVIKIAVEKSAVEAKKVEKVVTAKKVAEKPIGEVTKLAKITVKEVNEKPAIEVKKSITVSAKKVVEKPAVEAKIAEKEVVKPQTIIPEIVKKEVTIVKRTPLNDLTVVEGIGPKISQILYDHDVKNFKALIATPVENLKTWLKENKMQFVDPTSWAEQAGLADTGKLLELEALKIELKNGKRVKK
jgi:predicted flap endonuclease-1-like 5' DNA nuclease